MQIFLLPPRLLTSLTPKWLRVAIPAPSTWGSHCELRWQPHFPQYLSWSPWSPSCLGLLSRGGRSSSRWEAHSSLGSEPGRPSTIWLWPQPRRWSSGRWYQIYRGTSILTTSQSPATGTSPISDSFHSKLYDKPNGWTAYLWDWQSDGVQANWWVNFRQRPLKLTALSASRNWLLVF